MPLSSITPLFKGIRATPPDEIDLQHIDGKTRQALSSLSQLVALLNQNVPTTVIAVERHWDQIWPWVEALSRCVLESEGTPKSPDIEAEFTNVLDILSAILIYPLFKHQRVEIPHALRPLLSSTPQILPLSTRLWLYASHHGYPPDIITALSYCVGGFMICDSCSRPNEGAPKPFLDVIGSTKYDVGEGIVKDIARHLSGPESSYHYLVGPVIILYTAQFHPDLDCRTKCLAKGVVRWLGVMIRRLISRKSKLQWAFWFDEITVCVGQGMHFLNGIVKNNPEGILEALDEGLIPAIVRARDYILEDGRRRHEEHETKGSPSAFFEEFLELIRRRLLFRRVMLRAVRAVRAVQKMELPQDDYLDAYGKVNRAWNKLEVEAERRSRIYKSEDRVANTYGEKICGYEKVVVVSFPS
ncbi:hypothetical protein V5O48_018120 [Marasmius crinis-equi]|uniref:Uncharacterized protein n=1 Tax=Marasmius crinis-equi TaxID=585013 RepID=A0ABR3EM48_9AGAR